jgi:molecular chaperone GrpE
VNEPTVHNKKHHMDDLPPEETAAAEAPQADSLELLRAERDQAKAERDQAKAERDDLKELLLRRQAEFDNFRKRTEKERTDYVQYAGMELVRDLLPILDDFHRAMKSDGGAPEYTRGVELIYHRLYETLKKLGLEPIETAEQNFDPHLHQAVERVETTDAPEGTILVEFQRGYNFKGKLLRPSMVKVAVRA